MSLYAEYVKERGIDQIYETDVGFATYRYTNGGKGVYIVDIFIDPTCRKIGAASGIADAIVNEAHIKGCTELFGSVVPQAKGSTESLQVLLAYGMKLHSIENGLVVFRKEI